jgi:dolichol-phosphate mannosyltransferase
MSAENTLAYRIRTAARRPASWMQLLRFGIVGVTGYIINLGVFALLADTLSVHHVIAAVGAFCVAVTNNFLWNRYWTFEPGDGHPAFQAARFFAVSVAALGMNIAVLQALVAGAGMQDLGAQAIAVAVAMPFNFLGNKLWTFA